MTTRKRSTVRILFHVTPKKNLKSIIRNGLDPKLSLGAHERVWLADGTKALWAISHISQWQECRENDLVFLDVEVDRKDVHKFREGIFYSRKWISPLQIKHVVAVSDL